MSTNTVTPNPDTEVDRGSSNLHIYVTDGTAVTPRLFPGGAVLHVTVGDLTFGIGTVRGADSLGDLDVIEAFLHRCLDAVGVGRARHAARQLPCGGVCQPATWPEGAVMCQAVANALGCTRHAGHPGLHVSCADLDGGHISHISHTWDADTWDADTEGAVA